MLEIGPLSIRTSVKSCLLTITAKFQVLINESWACHTVWGDSSQISLAVFVRQYQLEMCWCTWKFFQKARQMWGSQTFTPPLLYFIFTRWSSFMPAEATKRCDLRTERRLKTMETWNASGELFIWNPWKNLQSSSQSWEKIGLLLQIFRVCIVKRASRTLLFWVNIYQSHRLQSQTKKGPVLIMHYHFWRLKTTVCVYRALSTPLFSPPTFSSSLHSSLPLLLSPLELSPFFQAFSPSEHFCSTQWKLCACVFWTPSVCVLRVLCVCAQCCVFF